ncbi:GtrA family protein [Phytohabitans sp. ZYX-F-186]|uniref:GtrA family protein n=1 Tax=Phytohabitans maris TaxID=3071409 RepID=A0ABU0ZP93_9ACTN|nr:GtrA family protein [Phytohabitans sp. ZYX-F-186]MDQ7908541.1 GtrA family protein [Phytohabitans sp. ZYX-F-186]
MRVLDGVVGAVRERGPRYLAVAVANVVFGQIVLWLLQLPFPDGRRAVVNAVSVVVCAIPAYYANRAWVWRRTGRSSWRREVLPFWLFVAVGLGATTGGVAAVEAVWRLAAEGSLPRPLTNLTNLAATGLLWVARFFWMDAAFRAVEEPVGEGGAATASGR